MKILFICSGAEPAKDGIGDYTYKLGLECKKLGHEIFIVAFNDRYLTDKKIDKSEIPSYRLPSTWNRNKREINLIEITSQVNPDVISLQFVGYGFNSRGIVYSLSGTLKKLAKDYSIHIMFHEIWIAEEREAKFKNKILGIFQKDSIEKLINKINPVLIHTSIPIYHKILNHYHIQSKILPIFSNINYSKSIDSHWFLSQISACLPQPINEFNRNQYIIGGFFGSIYSKSWEVESLFIQLKNYAEQTGKKIIITSIGRLEEGKGFWENLPIKYPCFNYCSFGSQEERKISQWLQLIDFGIITTPYLLLGKSGSFMAMKEHGVPVFCDMNKINFNFEIVDDSLNPYEVVMVDEEPIDFEKVLNKKIPYSGVQQVAAQFLKDLQDSK